MLSVDKRDLSYNNDENTEGTTSEFFHKNRFEPLLAGNSEEGGDKDGDSGPNGDGDDSNNDYNDGNSDSDDDNSDGDRDATEEQYQCGKEDC